MHPGRFGVILNGASCTGKTYLLRHALRDFPQLHVHDMDREPYYRPEELRSRLPEYAAWLAETVEFAELLEDVGASEPRVRVPKIALLKLIAGGRTFLTTCATLPLPGDTFYELVRQSTGVRLFHVLLDPSGPTHWLRILLRLRLVRAAEFRRKQREKQHATWDARIRTRSDLQEFLNGDRFVFGENGENGDRFIFREK